MDTFARFHLFPTSWLCSAFCRSAVQCDCSVLADGVKINMRLFRGLGGGDSEDWSDSGAPLAAVPVSVLYSTTPFLYFL